MRKFKRLGRFYVYIVKCRGGTYYTGSTNNIARRLKLHSSGRGAKYTRDRRPVKLVWCKEYKYFKRAFLEEKRIKKLTRMQKKELVKSMVKYKKGLLRKVLCFSFPALWSLFFNPSQAYACGQCSDFFWIGFVLS